MDWFFQGTEKTSFWCPFPMFPDLRLFFSGSGWRCPRSSQRTGPAEIPSGTMSFWDRYSYCLVVTGCHEFGSFSHINHGFRWSSQLTKSNLFQRRGPTTNQASYRLGYYDTNLIWSYFIWLVCPKVWTIGFCKRVSDCFRQPYRWCISPSYPFRCLKHICSPTGSLKKKSPICRRCIPVRKSFWRKIAWLPMEHLWTPLANLLKFHHITMEIRKSEKKKTRWFSDFPKPTRKSMQKPMEKQDWHTVFRCKSHQVIDGQHPIIYVHPIATRGGS